MTLRYKRRTLLILMALGPPVLAGAWIAGQKALADHCAKREREREIAAMVPFLRTLMLVEDSERPAQFDDVFIGYPPSSISQPSRSTP